MEESKEQKEKKRLSNFTKFIIGEGAVLIIALLVCRGWVFPFLARGGMGHVEIATHVMMIGVTATIFSVFAILFRRVWSTHKKYVLIPAIFTVFGFLMQMIASELNF